MKKHILFILFVVVIFITFLLVYTKSRNYSLSYVKDSYEIVENYNKNFKIYTFVIKHEGNNYEFLLEHKYTTKRKIVENIEVKKSDEYTCLAIKALNEKTPYICRSKDGNYVDAYIANLSEEYDSHIIDTYHSVEIYDQESKYLLWDGYGLLDINNRQEYHFLKEESYTNNLAYNYENYILFADYDQVREFNKFYIYNANNKKVSEWEIDYKISFDSYFMGHFDNKIYLFDKKNEVQYSISIEKESIAISSDSDGAFVYDKEETTIPLKNAKYDNITFNYNQVYNYLVINNQLYLKYYNMENNIKVSDSEITAIIKVIDDKVYYLSGVELYSYSQKEGNKLLLRNFEWNFTYDNKIYIF